MGPVIASVSLGAERLFRLRAQNGTVVFAEKLLPGSLLIMAGQRRGTSNTKFPRNRL
jgi:alkylated DNA repair dioxygenase AlkB